MSNVHKEQLALMFKPDTLKEVSRTEVALLVNWIEDILLKMDLDDERLPDDRLMN